MQINFESFFCKPNDIGVYLGCDDDNMGPCLCQSPGAACRNRATTDNNTTMTAEGQQYRDACRLIHRTSLQ